MRRAKEYEQARKDYQESNQGSAAQINSNQSFVSMIDHSLLVCK